ncbi:MAG: triose-phosphate isomerase [Bacteroidales bacterium]|nr:triose-phosphate isomerase [Bacteroidales bacterium]
MRQKIVAGNWKMNKDFEDAEVLLDDIYNAQLKYKGDVQVIVCPPTLYLELATDYANDEEMDEAPFGVGAQNVSEYVKGAYTGEISAQMLASMGITHCIVGHSERRKYFGETDKIIAEKINLLLSYSMQPIYCCGEVLEEREAGKHIEVVAKQIQSALFHLTPEEFSNIIIAYEPVWAIGTGKNATPEQAQEMHDIIRKLILEKYGNEVANDTSILYGGSCNAKNARELFAMPDVDGGLIGGASLIAEDFLKIRDSFVD